MYYNMNKKLIKLTESDLHNIVKESVKRVLKEEGQIDIGGFRPDITDWRWEKTFLLLQELYKRLNVHLMDDSSDHDAWSAFWNLCTALEYRMNRPLDH